VTLEKTFDPGETKHIQTEAEANGKADFILNPELKDAHNLFVSLENGIWQIRKTEQR
jgi:hypothetical protein